MEIRPRSDWGPRYRAGFGALSLPVRELWLHHSVTGKPFSDLNSERAAMRTLENIGQDRFGAGVSYTLAVMPSGRIYEGTGVGRIGAHTYRRNSFSHAFVLVGDYSRVGPTAVQQHAIAECLRDGKARGWWREARLTGGHRDVRSTGCPGDAAYATITNINRLAGAAPAPIIEAPPPAAPIFHEEEDMFVFKYGPHHYSRQGGVVGWFWDAGSLHETLKATNQVHVPAVSKEQFNDWVRISNRLQGLPVEQGVIK